MKDRTFVIAILWLLLSGCAHKLPDSETKKSLSAEMITKVESIDREEIRRTIAKNIKEIRSCFEQELVKDKSLYGKIVLDFEIMNEGKVKSTSVKTNTTGSKHLAECVQSNLKKWTFPSPPNNQIVRVTYPFVFVPKDVR